MQERAKLSGVASGLAIRDSARSKVSSADAEAQLKARLARERPTGTKYKVETYMVIVRWTEGTCVEYGPNPKTPGSKSHPRYERYAKAKTVGEALALGAYPPDLLWDYERGFYKVVGGPLRDEPLDLEKAKAAGEKITRTDEILGKWVLRTMQKELGVSLEWLRSGPESPVCRALRLFADRKAVELLATVDRERRPISSQEMLQLLRAWSYVKNPHRNNVMKPGQTWVNSDTVGLTVGRDGDVHATRATLSFPNVMKAICRYIRDRQPAELKAPFHFTSVNMNYGYGATRHRDSNNTGLSMLAGFGDFSGGELCYWPDDDGSVPRDKLAKLPASGCVIVDVKENLLLFHGQRCHEVKPFKGERYSLVWFSSARYWKADEKTLKHLEELGFVIPTEQSVRAVSSALRPARGHHGTAQPAAGGALTWPMEQASYSGEAEGEKRSGASREVQPQGKRRRASSAGA